LKFAYYPGCSLKGTALEYEKSLIKVCKDIDIELLEIEDWNCCGATPAHQVNKYLAIALPARNIIKAEKMGLSLVTPCAACFSRIRFASHYLKDNRWREILLSVLGEEYAGNLESKHLLQIFIEEQIQQKIKEKILKPLSGLKVACYYGCLLLRPPEVASFDDPEHPTAMETLVHLLGGEVVEWNFYNECCGASFALSNPQAMENLVYKILLDATFSGANCFMVACPLCHSNLDTRQVQVNKHFKKHFSLPVFYFTQLVGLALGYPPKELGLYSHLTNPMGVLER